MTPTEALRHWYDHNRRRLPWRALPGETADPYRVWLSEIMLQQTTVATVTGYFQAFLVRWPTVTDLAAAPLDDVLTQWAGLGYYARARNLHTCARAVVDRHGGRFPDDEADLLKLPGLGAYTAAAVAAIAFNRPATPVDGNIERVVARLNAVATPLPAAKAIIRDHARALTPTERPGDHAQAMMDLGATICTPRRPACALCPLAPGCAARRLGTPEAFPVKPPKPPKPTRYGVAFWCVRGDGAALLVRRPEKGLLGGMIGLPTTDWTEAPADLDQARRKAPLPAPWRPVPGLVVHVFTHFRLELTVLSATVRLGDPRLGLWVKPENFAAHAIPTLFAKAIKLAQGGR